MLDAKTEEAVARITEEARTAFGTDLVSVVLYGSAAGADFVAGSSDLNFAIVLESISVSHLQALAARLPAWHRLGASTPLFVDRAFVERAVDVFPMEILEIQADHRVLVGVDLFAEIAVDFDHLLHQLEYESRAKLLRLQVLFAESGGKRKQVEEILRESVTPFLVVMRALLRFRNVRRPPSAVLMLDRFEEEFALPLPAVREVLGVKLGERRWTRDAVAMFADYLEDIERLVDLVDRAALPPAPEEDTSA